MAGFADADDHVDKQKDHPNKIMSGKECMETKGWGGMVFICC